MNVTALTQHEHHHPSTAAATKNSQERKYHEYKRIALTATKKERNVLTSELSSRGLALACGIRGTLQVPRGSLTWVRSASVCVFILTAI